MADEEEFPLHKCVFSGDLRKLSALIRVYDVSKRDKHGMSISYVLLNLILSLHRRNVVYPSVKEHLA